MTSRPGRDYTDPERPSQRTVSANGTAPPSTSAARSAFDMAPKPPKRTWATWDPAAVEIKRVPIPEAVRNVGGRYQALLARMKPGDCVELPAKLGKGLVSHAKKAGLAVSIRKLSDDLVGVWRTK